MTINDRIRDEKLQYDINRKAAKIQALSSGKIHKYEYLTDEDILPSYQQQIIEQARFTYSRLGKAIQDQGQLKTIKNMIMMLKILHLSQNKKKYLINLQMKGVKK